MLVDLRNVPPDGKTVDFSVEPHSLLSDSRDIQFIEAVTVKARLVKGELGSVSLIGSVGSTVTISCVRCLEQTKVVINEKLSLIYVPQSENVAKFGDNDRSLNVDELSVSFYENEEIDLTHMAWEQVVLGLPMSPVCSEQCRGLCTQCGTNRNSGSCECVYDDVDARWEPLRSLT